MKIHFIFFLSHAKLAKMQEKHSFNTDFTAEHVPTLGRYL